MSYAKKSKIRESKTHKEVIPYKGYDGRMKVRLIDNFGHEQEEDFAELVARTFPEMVCGTKQEGVPYPYHRDNKPENNAVDNLFWPDKELYDCDNNKASVVSLIDTSAADYGEIALMLNRLLLDLGDYGDIPVIREMDIGHTAPHFTMVNGALTALDWENGRAKIRFSYE